MVFEIHANHLIKCHYKGQRRVFFGTATTRVTLSGSLHYWKKWCLVISQNDFPLRSASMPLKNTKLDNKKPSEEQRTLDLESEVLQILAPSFCCINLGEKKITKIHFQSLQCLICTMRIILPITQGCHQKKSEKYKVPYKSITKMWCQYITTVSAH